MILRENSTTGVVISHNLKQKASDSDVYYLKTILSGLIRFHLAGTEMQTSYKAVAEYEDKKATKSKKSSVSWYVLGCLFPKNCDMYFLICTLPFVCIFESFKITFLIIIRFW